MPYLYSHPERFRVGTLPRAAAGPVGGERWRYTVDTPEDLELATALADRLGHGPPVRLDELEAILGAEPGLALLNAGVAQKTWQTAQATEGR
jgi:spore coat polysaccharide biosynthesis protein SpsF (cytidylyltransferase family)